MQLVIKWECPACHKRGEINTENHPELSVHLTEASLRGGIASLLREKHRATSTDCNVTFPVSGSTWQEVKKKLVDPPRHKQSTGRL